MHNTLLSPIDRSKNPTGKFGCRALLRWWREISGKFFRSYHIRFATLQSTAADVVIFLHVTSSNALNAHFSLKSSLFLSLSLSSTHNAFRCHLQFNRLMTVNHSIHCGRRIQNIANSDWNYYVFLWFRRYAELRICRFLVLLEPISRLFLKTSIARTFWYARSLRLWYIIIHFILFKHIIYTNFQKFKFIDIAIIRYH